MKGMNAGERVFINTVAISTRCVISAVLSFFSTRFVLGAIGVEDYGVYAVVAGIMGFMGFLNDAMATGSQRHLAYGLGQGDRAQVGKVFSACLGIHLGLVVLLIILGETLGLWFLGHVLHIPESRRAAAGWLYQFTIVSVVASVMSVPFQAILTAHEALVTTSLLITVQSLLSLAVALALSHLPGDLLIVYAISVCAIQILVVGAQLIIALRRYPESRVSLRILPAWSTVVQIISFSMWYLFGAFSAVARLQGTAFLLNIFFGTSINAAYNVANQVGAQASNVTWSMLQAVSPHMTKSESIGARDSVISLGLLINKYAFLLDCLWLFPLYVELPTVLHLWLKNVPPYTTEFCRMVLLLVVLDKISSGFVVTVTAIGKVALYQAVLGLTRFCVLPGGWLACKLGWSPLSIFRIALALFALSTLLQVWFVRRLTGMRYSRWLRSVVLPVAFASLPAVVLTYVLCVAMTGGLLRLFCLALVVSPALALGTILFGMNATERSRWLDLAKALRGRLVSRSDFVAPSTPLAAMASVLSERPVNKR